MKLELHQKTIENYNERADKLLTQLKQDPHDKKGRQGEPIIFAHKIPGDAVRDFTIRGYVDSYGKESARIFKHGQQYLGLFDEDYKFLVKLAERMQNSDTLRNSVSLSVLTNLIFEWVTERYQSSTTLSMTEYVLQECENQIKEMEIWIPIAYLSVQSEIKLGKVTFKPITKEMLDVFQLSGEASLAEVSVEARIGMNKIRQDLQGFAAATIRLTAEPNRAIEIAFNEAEASISLLRFFAPANFSPRRISYCTLRGREHVERAKSLIVENGNIISYNGELIDRGTPDWELTNELMLEFKSAGLDVLDRLLDADSRTDFQEELLSSLLQYSKNCLAKDPSDKLINILVALETIILKDENEPIKKNIGERMAVLFGQSADERIEIIASVSKTYDLRSKFIHHGYRVSLEETETLETFMMNAWRCFHALVVISNKNPTMTKSQFSPALERRRLSY